MRGFEPPPGHRPAYSKELALGIAALVVIAIVVLVIKGCSF
jgi:hypothetical protein